jgi:TetR/AcrR family transcriptional regulator, cholesterol catabolism regulator
VSADAPRAAQGRLAELFDIAEKLFSERGYAAVSLRDIAEAVGVRQASLYHYVPGGKEALYIEVTERGLRRTQAAIEQATAQAGPLLRDQLRSTAGVLLAQPPFDIARMIRSDMPAISEAQAERLTRLAYDALIEPIAGVFQGANNHEPRRGADERLLAGLLLAIVETAQIATRFSPLSATTMTHAMIDLIVDGLERQAAAGGDGP